QMETVSETAAADMTTDKPEFKWLSDLFSLVSSMNQKIVDYSDGTVTINVNESLMVYIFTKTHTKKFINKLTEVMNVDDASDLSVIFAQNKPMLDAAELVLGAYVNSDMTADMTSDGLLITIGGDSNNKVEFLYSLTATTQSSNVPEWFDLLFQMISTLMSDSDTDTSVMLYLSQSYPGVAKLSQAIAIVMQSMTFNIDN
ncbi:MAG: hypothetical protein J6Y01_03205, partial [Spirochaetales bacterium]|nr:hypothetical protein [Spirochaetales bacterium]